MFTRGVLTKAIKLAVICIFTVQALCAQGFAEEAHTYFSPVQDTSAINIKDILIPTRLGFVDGEFSGTSGKTVFLIKDAHCDYAAQKTIASIIDWIVSRYGVTLVNLEGGSGEYDFRAIDKIDNEEAKRSVLEEHLNQGKISGPEYYRILNNDKVSLAGIEDAYLYQENLASYHNIILYRDKVEAFIAAISKILIKERDKVFSEEFKYFDDTTERYANNEIDIASYIVYLSKTAREKNQDIRDYPNILKMAKVLLLEKSIDFQEADSQKENIVKELSGRISRYERFKLLEKTARFYDGDISDAEFYSFLADKARSVGIEEDSFKSFFAYAKYADIYFNVDKAGLFDELNRLEKALESSMLAGEDEQYLAEQFEQVRLLKKALSLRLDPYSLNQLKSVIDIESLVNFAREHIQDAEYRILEENAVYLAQSYSSIMVFYYLANKRDEAFLRNIRENMLDANTDVSIVVTGGFHYESLGKLLREEGISYISVNPSFKNKEGYINPYLDIISGKTDTFTSGVINAMTSTIQVKSAWSSMAIEEEFISKLLSRIELILQLEKESGTQEVLFELGDRKLFFSKSSDYAPNLLYPHAYKLRDQCKVINWVEFMDVSPIVMQKKLNAFFTNQNRDQRLAYLDDKGLSGKTDPALTSVLKSNTLETEPGKSFAPKKALLRPNGHIVEREVRGMKNVDTYVYVFDLETGVLTCQSSETMTGAESGYMLEPQVEGNDNKPNDEKNEKWYLCNRLMKVFKPGSTIIEQKQELAKLLYEQHEYESRIGSDGKHSCGWEWDIDHDEDGSIYIDPDKFLGLRALRIYDRTRLPEGVFPRKMDRDAMIYGGVENVQEMKFSIVPSGSKIRIELITSWAASEKEQVLERAANISAVSGLPNKRFFEKVALPNLIGKGGEALPVSVLFIDGDNFKHYNDDYNHEVGDEVIKAIAEAINKSVRGSDIVMNWGGDEFVVVLPSALATNAKAVANNILEQIKRIDFKKVLEDAGYKGDAKPADKHLSATIGLAMAATIDEVIKLKDTINAADEMLKYAKRSHKGTVMVLSEYDELEEFNKDQGFKEVQMDRMPIDLRLVLDEYLPSVKSNLRTFLERDYIKGMPQGEILRNIYEEMKLDRSLKKLIKKLNMSRQAFQEDKDKEREAKELIAEDVRRDMRKLYYKLLVYKLNINEAIGDTPASRNVSTAIASINDAVYLTYRYVMRDWEEIRSAPSDSREWSDPSGNTITLPSFGRIIADNDPEDVPKEEAIFAGKYDDVADLLRTALSIIRTMFESEAISGFDEEILTDDVFSTYAKELNRSYTAAGLVSPEAEFENLKAIEEYKKWLTGLSFGTCRFPKEKRLIVYPVYSEAALAQEMKMSHAVRRGIAGSDYAFNIVPIPYLADNEQSYESAFESMREVIRTDKSSRAMVYSSEELYSRSNGILRSRVVYVKEEGYDDALEDFTYMGLAIRSAFSIAVMDYFDPRNELKEEHRDKLKDMIAAMLGIITRDDKMMELFKDDPKALIEGMIVIKPAERVAWDEVKEKVDAERQFVYSL